MNKKNEEKIPKKRTKGKEKADDNKEVDIELETKEEIEDSIEEPDLIIDTEPEEPEILGEEEIIPEEIDTSELSEILNKIDEEDDTLEDVIELIKEDEPSDIAPTTEIADLDEDSIVEILEEVEQRPKSRWLITTCRYCGDMYRFRSDQAQPPTCGKQRCLVKFEELSRKKSVSNVKAVR